MTETGHGSDVQQLRTTCTYDPATADFDLHTPHEAARKDYIGNAAQRRPDGRRLRPADHRRRVATACTPGWCRSATRTATRCPASTIGDDGPKAGLLGVDNGRLTLRPRAGPARTCCSTATARSPRTARTPARSRTRPAASSPCSARWSAAGSASAAPPASATKKALTIAVRYGDSPPPVRRTRRPTREIVLNDYLAHQRKLLPALATTYALHFAQEELVGADARGPGAPCTSPVDEHRAARAGVPGRRAQGRSDLARHRAPSRRAARPAAARATWPRTGCPRLKADTDVFTTFEGDNTVLLQLVAKGLLTGYRDAFGSLDGWGRVGFVAEQVRETVLERTAARGADPAAGRRRTRPRRRGRRCSTAAGS